MESKLLEIGEIVTTQRALELCEYFGLDYLVERIRANPAKYKSWKFDGCSAVPDELLGLFTGCDWENITFKCCLPHDLRYAYGELGNSEERKRADTQFQDDLVTKAEMKEILSYCFLAFVRTGGAEELGLSFSWGFAHNL
jgi:hypothetical protein